MIYSRTLFFFADILNVAEHFLLGDFDISNVCCFEEERSVFCDMGPTLSAIHLIVGSLNGLLKNRSQSLINLYISSAD